jgi:ribosomal-protein-alanine N-acetyltransferase
VESRIELKTILETERLILRPFQLGDEEALFAMNTNPDVIRYAGNTPFTSLDQARDTLTNVIFKDYEVLGYGRFALVLKETGKVIGFSGVKYIADIEETELGYRLMPEHWGKGLATESAIASIDFARVTLGLKRLVALVHPDNHASSKVVHKLGFSVERKISFALVNDVDVNLYARAI